MPELQYRPDRRGVHLPPEADARARQDDPTGKVKTFFAALAIALALFAGTREESTPPQIVAPCAAPC